MALLNKWVESLDYEYEILSSCTRHRSHHSNCVNCVDACEKQAISIKNGKPVIEDSKCIQCGDCMPACPVQAIAGILPQRKIKENRLIISDDQFPTTTELLILHHKGIRSIVFEDESFAQKWKQRMEQVNEMLMDLEESPFSVSIGSVEDEEFYSRRALFSLWKKESKSLMKQMTPAKWRFNQQALNLRQYYLDYQFTKLTIDTDKCTLCPVCERICEQKCFAIQDGQFTISAQNCSSCHLCADICPEKAITIEEKITKIKSIQHTVYENKCQTCHQPFRTLHKQETTCPICMKIGDGS